ncbi:hypothetical protein SPOG_00103 [Schizosaccharomyces cryophilus OY26]|uniref:Uncharacterized protein n=1 Tax=Schizosaccharomyces cryophilus (strain OY26 / ATCC MYA-4695 / CBS 11777 / NBRC 106824 / NRRL Y48691) TaxID=653667 RepID=S9VV66_SCHCR|nr:uncharacterized protein SPOG_00103 [Schizosaccharomyces cryophilus OY26]EPY51678.1 hypothetical protein SPOG_00103 [Schizosaccharomyces cryophilus OY26]
MDDLIASFAAGNHSQTDKVWSEITPFSTTSPTEDIISEVAASEIYSWKDNAVQLDPFNFDEFNRQLDKLYGPQKPPKRISMASKSYVGITPTSDSVFQKLLRLDAPEHGLPELRHGAVSKLLREHMSFWNQERTNVHRKTGAVFCWSTAYKKQKSKERIQLTSPATSPASKSPGNTVLLSPNMNQSSVRQGADMYKPSLNKNGTLSNNKIKPMNRQVNLLSSSKESEEEVLPLSDSSSPTSDDNTKHSQARQINNTKEGLSAISTPGVKKLDLQNHGSVPANIESLPSKPDPVQLIQYNTTKKSSDITDEINSIPSTEWGDWMSAKTDSSSRNFNDRQTDLLLLSSRDESEKLSKHSEEASEYAPSLP